MESVVTDDFAKRELRVHFIAYKAPSQTTPPERRPYALPALMEDLSHFEAKLSGLDRIKSARAETGELKVNSKLNTVDLQTRAVHNVVIIDY